VIGSIPEEEFVSARLQFGEGMNPGSWLQIGQEITAPSFYVRLGVWDTTELEDGIYALQLVLIQERQQIEKVSLIVSVDNTSPEITFITDLAEGEMPSQPGEEIIFEVGFRNVSEIAEVQFYLDDELLQSRRTPPYVYPWTTRIGEHDLLIIAVDQAGNTAEYSTTFSIVQE
jgi:hypothetical protein